MVNQSAVMGKGNIRIRRRCAENRLRILPLHTPRRGVTGMANRQMPLESLQRLFIENLADQAQVFENDDLLTIPHSNTGSFLATVLEGEQTIVRNFCYILARSPHAEDTAFVVGLIVENWVIRYHDPQSSSYKATSPKR